jgi:signal transduction histidine kinase
MLMSDFIENHLEAILQDWENFAAKQTPGSTGMSKEELRDFAEDVLCSVVHDMRLEQSEDTRHEKSVGEPGTDKTNAVTNTARAHAMERLSGGFTLYQLVAEYRALRASVIRHWRNKVGKAGEEELEQLMRFNEAIDESLTEAASWYNSRVEEARMLLNGALAHDLRSPLGAVLAAAEVLLHEQTLDARQLRMALTIRNGANRIKGMINDLLDFTRTRLGTGLPINVRECNMKRIISNLIEENGACHPEAEIDFEFDGDPTGCWDAGRIEQMFGNLIGNALEHGQKSPVRIVGCAHDKEVTVAVHNKGNVIPKEKLSTIFDPLKGGSEPNHPQHTSRAGLGLGLYIVRQIAEAHDGDVEVDSSAETGTTFTVRLPRKPKKSSEVAGLT